MSSTNQGENPMLSVDTDFQNRLQIRRPIRSTHTLRIVD